MNLPTRRYPGRKLFWKRNEMSAKVNSPFGFERPDLPVETMCQSCKNEDTQRVVDPYDLAPYADYYAGRQFEVFKCFCCGAVWHHEKT